ncbi:MAG: hypothetical protein RIR55_566 [Bacteroidota bacterium]|jgi:hypothetical protein
MQTKILLPILFVICATNCVLHAQTNHELSNEPFTKVFKKRVNLITGMNFNKQTITLNDYTSRFNYDLNDYQKNLYKPAYFLGLRWETKQINNHKLAFTALLSKIASGNNYKDANKLSPFINNYSKFLAEDQFFILNLSAYYKQLIPINNTSKYQLYYIIGPSINTRLSDQIADNQINDNYNKYYISGDGGLEFNNQSFYTLFVHYKYGLNSFTKTPVASNLNNVELGAMVKLSDIF